MDALRTAEATRRISLLAALLSLGVSVLAANAPRSTISLDQNWRFHLGDITNAIAPGFKPASISIDSR